MRQVRKQDTHTSKSRAGAERKQSTTNPAWEGGTPSEGHKISKMEKLHDSRKERALGSGSSERPYGRSRTHPSMHKEDIKNKILEEGKECDPSGGLQLSQLPPAFGSDPLLTSQRLLLQVARPGNRSLVQPTGLTEEISASPHPSPGTEGWICTTDT